MTAEPLNCDYNVENSENACVTISLTETYTNTHTNAHIRIVRLSKECRL